MHFIDVDTAWQLRHDRRQQVLDEFASTRTRRRRRSRAQLVLVRER